MRTTTTQNRTRSTEPYGAPLSEMQMTATWPVIEIPRANIDSSWGFHCPTEREERKKKVIEKGRKREMYKETKKQKKKQKTKQDWTEANN